MIAAATNNTVQILNWQTECNATFSGYVQEAVYSVDTCEQLRNLMSFKVDCDASLIQIYNGANCDGGLNSSIALRVCTDPGVLASSSPTELTLFTCENAIPPLIQNNAYTTLNCTGNPQAIVYFRTDNCVIGESGTSSSRRFQVINVWVL
jgi:hypothetical protein